MMGITAAMLMNLAWKSLIVAGATLLLLRLMRSRSAAERSMIAHLGLTALLILPAAILLLPAWTPLPASWLTEATMGAVSTVPANIQVATPDTATVPVVSGAAAPMATTWPSAQDVAPWLYALPLVLLVGVMLLAVVRLFAMRTRADVLVDGNWLSALAGAQRRMGFKHGTALLVSEELRSPISWGVLRPTIVLDPRAVAAVGEAEAIIAHELAHVARLDWAKLLGARVACALYWFNPFVWMLARECHQLREEAADDAVLMADIDGPDYATLLVGAARHDNQSRLLAAHGVAPSADSLKRRIMRVLDGGARRAPANAAWMIAGALIFAGVTGPLAAFSPTTQQAEAAKADAARAERTARREAAQGAHAAKLAAEDSGQAAQEAGQTAADAMQNARDAEQAAKVAAVDAAEAAANSVQLIDRKTGRAMTPVHVSEAEARLWRERYGMTDYNDIVVAKTLGVTSDYLDQMRRLFPRAKANDLIGARSVGVRADFASDMRKHFPDAGLDDMIALKTMGVDCDFVTELERSGQRKLTVDQAVRARFTGKRRQPPAPPRSGSMTITSSDRTATIRVDGNGQAMEARGADGSVARIEWARPPVPPRPPEQ